jgi:CspA family cold shock protein
MKVYKDKHNLHNKMSEEQQTNRVTGCVKWFKNGYGFIIDMNGEDIFVHHSGINENIKHYKYLVQGEYVEFEVTPTKPESKYKFQAVNVTGIHSGKLMCETREERRLEYSSDVESCTPRTRTYYQKNSKQ